MKKFAVDPNTGINQEPASLINEEGGTFSKRRDMTYEVDDSS